MFMKICFKLVYKSIAVRQGIWKGLAKNNKICCLVIWVSFNDKNWAYTRKEGQEVFLVVNLALLK